VKRPKYSSRYFNGNNRSKKPSQASSIIAKAIPNIPLGPRLHEFRIKREWPTLVGKAIAARTLPTKLIKGTLYCVVTSSAWMTELNFQKPLIIEKINQAVGPGAVVELVFKPGLIPAEPPAPPPVEAPSRGRLSSGFIETATADINDEKLKSILKRVMKKSPF